jgi:hypothetical protein
LTVPQSEAHKSFTAQAPQAADAFASARKARTLFVVREIVAAQNVAVAALAVDIGREFWDRGGCHGSIFLDFLPRCAAKQPIPGEKLVAIRCQDFVIRISESFSKSSSQYERQPRSNAGKARG